MPNFREKDSEVDTSDDSKNRSPRRLTGTRKGEGHESHIDLTKKNSDINITDELTSWLQVGEGNNQAKPSKNSDVNDIRGARGDNQERQENIQDVYPLGDWYKKLFVT